MPSTPNRPKSTSTHCGAPWLHSCTLRSHGGDTAASFANRKIIRPTRKKRNSNFKSSGGIFSLPFQYARSISASFHLWFSPLILHSHASVRNPVARAPGKCLYYFRFIRRAWASSCGVEFYDCACWHRDLHHVCIAERNKRELQIISMCPWTRQKMPENNFSSINRKC